MRKFLINERQERLLREGVISNDDPKHLSEYVFLSEVKAFINMLKRDPANAEPSKTLKDAGFTRISLLKQLTSRKLISMLERLPDYKSVEGGKIKVKIRYVVPSSGFVNKMRHMYYDLFEGKGVVDECDCAGACAGATSADASGQFVTALDAESPKNPKRKKKNNVISRPLFGVSSELDN